MLKIQSFKFLPKKTPHENVFRFRALVSAAIDAGAQVNDSVLVPALLQALPDSWIWLKRSLSTVTNQSITNFYAHIADEQARLEGEACSARINPQNLLAVYYSETRLFGHPG